MGLLQRLPRGLAWIGEDHETSFDFIACPFLWLSFLREVQRAAEEQQQDDGDVSPPDPSTQVHVWVLPALGGIIENNTETSLNPFPA